MALRPRDFEDRGRAAESRWAYGRTCGRDSRRRPDGADAGGRVGAGGNRRRDRRAARRARTSPARAPAACTRARSRSSTSAESPIDSSRRDRWRRSRGSPAPVWTSATFPPGTLRARALAEPHRAHPRRLGRRAEGAGPPRREVTGFAQDDTGVDVAAVRRRSRCGRSTSSGATEDAAWSARQPASSSPGGIRRRAPDRRGRDDRGAGIGHPPHSLGHACPGQGRVRDQGRRGGLRTGRNGRGHADRVRGRNERAHPARSQRGPHRRLRDRLRDPQSHVHLQVHRHDSAGRGLPRPDGSCWPATRRTCIPRSVGRASTPVCRMR